MGKRKNPTIAGLFWSGRRDSNPQPSPWQGDTLPLSHFRMKSSLEDFVGAGEESRTPTP
jgi:hypothetical protein